MTRPWQWLLAAGCMLALLSVAPAAATAAPPNDDFANAEVLIGSSDHLLGNNSGATKEGGEPNHAGDPGGASVWYRWTAPANGVASIDTCGSTFDTLLGVYTGASVGALTGVQSNDDSPGPLCGGTPVSELSFNATSGTTYRIAVDGWSNAGGQPAATGALIVEVSLAAHPANDNMAGAQVLPSSSPVTASGSNAGATKEGGEPNHAGDSGGASVWYSWTAPETANFSIDTCRSDFDTLLGVYTTGPLTPVVSNNNSTGQLCGGLFQSEVTLAATMGTTYLIAVDGYSKNGTLPPTRGDVELAIRKPIPPANDNFASAQLLSGTSLNVSGTNRFATKQAGEPDHAGDSGGASVWYSWTAPASGTVSLDTCNSDFDTLLGVYTGSSVDNLFGVVSNDESGGPHCPFSSQSEVRFAAVAGTTYAIAVDGFAFNGLIAPRQGDIGLSLQLSQDGSLPPQPTPPDTKINSLKVKRPRHSGRPGSVRVTFSGSGAASFVCRIDGKPFSGCRSPAVFRLRPGRHTITVQALSASGNADPTPASRSFRVPRPPRS